MSSITNSGSDYTSAPTIVVSGSGTGATITASIGTSQKSVSGTKQGFQGYSFNGGNGYANTIYSHANFLAGKKINLLGKILTAINNVQTLYDQIKSKRSEFYEYNQ